MKVQLYIHALSLIHGSTIIYPCLNKKKYNFYSLGWKDNGMPAKNTATIYSQTPRVQFPLNPFLHIVQHVPDWVAPIPSSSPQIIDLI